MPVIPTGKGSRTGATPAAPNVPVQQFGKVGDAIANFGKDLSEVGFKMMEAQTRTSENDYVYKTQLDDINKMEIFKTEWNAKIKNEQDAKDYAIEAQKYAEKLTKENLKNAPTSRAGKEYEERSMKYYTKELLDINAQSQKYQGFYKEKSIMDEADKVAATQLMAPNSLVAKESISNLSQWIDKDTGTLFSPDYSVKVKEKALNTVAVNSFRGYLQSEDMDVLKQGLAELQKTDSGEVASYLSPDQKATLLNGFNNAMIQEQRKQVSMIVREVEDTQAALVDGVAVPGSNYASLKERLAAAKASGAIDEDTFKRMDSTLNVGIQANAMISQMKSQPASQWKSPDALVPKGSTFNYRELDQTRNAVAAAQNAELKKRYDDFPKYAAQNSRKVGNLQKQALNGDPVAVNNYVKNLDAYADSLGIPQDKRRVLSKDFSNLIGNQLNSLNNPQMKTEVMTRWQNSFGEKWNRAATDLVNDNVIPSDYLAASYMQDTATKTKIFSNIQGSKEITEGFKKGFSDVSNNDINDLILSENGELQQLLVGKGNDPKRLPYANAVMDQLSLEIKSRSLQQGKSPNADITAAVVNEFIGKNFDSVKSGNSNVMIPKGNYDTNQVSKFLDATSTKTGIEALKVKAPSGRSLDDYHKYLEKNAFWDVNDANDALVFYRPGTGGLPEPVADQNGKAIVVPFKDVNSYSQRFDAEKLRIEQDKRSKEQAKRTQRAISYFNQAMGLNR